jgi:hypothetical protein
MSVHERSAWACLLAITAVYVPYFWLVLRSPMAALGLFWVSAAGLVVLLVAFHVINAIATKSIRARGDYPPLDELDQVIELRAAKLAGFVLAFGVMTWILVTSFAAPVLGGGGVEAATLNADPPLPSAMTIPLMTAMVAIQCLFAGFVVANLAYYAGIVFGYRRIARG